jgi:GT2 family glycosyltransferase
MTFFMVKATVVIPNWNGQHWLKGCFEALKDQDFHDFEVLMIDDASTDGSVAYVQDCYPEVKVIRRMKQGGFAKTVNEGIRAASGKYVVLLNTDTIPSPSWLGELVRTMDRMPPGVGSLASSMRQMDDPERFDSAGDILTWYGQALKRGNNRPVWECDCSGEILAACAGAALYRREFLDATGGFDEEFGSYLEDVDLGLRGRVLGYVCRFAPAAVVLHKGHGSALPNRSYVSLVTRNRLMLFGKNIPLRLLVRHVPQLLIGQMVLFIQYRRPFTSIAGYLSLIPELPHVMRERRRILAARNLSDREIDSLLDLSPEGIAVPHWLVRSAGGSSP